MLALFPARYAPLLAFLRLGKAMSVFSFILLLVSGALGIASAFEILGVGRRALTGGAVLLVVFLLDLAFLAVLICWRAEEKAPASRPQARRAAAGVRRDGGAGFPLGSGRPRT